MPPFQHQPSCPGANNRMECSESVAVTLDTSTVDAECYRSFSSGKPARFSSVTGKSGEDLEAPLLGDQRSNAGRDSGEKQRVTRGSSKGEGEYRRIDRRGNSGFIDSVLNGINVLAGIGILSTPYATAQAGWLGLLVLLFFAAACCYTAVLLRRCMDFKPQHPSEPHSTAQQGSSPLETPLLLDDSADSSAASPSASPPSASPRASPRRARIVRPPRPIRSYPDIGEAAFGRFGRWLTAFLLYFELFAVTVELLILEGDNLAHLFPSGDVCLLPSRHSVGEGGSAGVWFLEGIARGGGMEGGGGGVGGGAEGWGGQEGMFGAAGALAAGLVRGIEPALEAVSVATGAGSLCLEPKQFYVILSALIVLPTVWLRDLSLLAYISAGGVLASLLLVFGVGWLKEVDNIGDIPGGVSSSTEWFKPMGLPAAAGLFGFCFSGHAVVPNLYRSMRKPDHFTPVMVVSFAVCTLLYGGMAILGYAMFGGSVQSQITLNLPPALSASKAVVWTTVVNPFTKFALTLLPIALALEETLPTAHSHSHTHADSHSDSHSHSHSDSPSHSDAGSAEDSSIISSKGSSEMREEVGMGEGGVGSGEGVREGVVEGVGVGVGDGVDSWQHIASATALRTALVAGAVTVALSVPFFGLVMAFIGSFLSLSISVMLPCACYVKLMGGPWREGGRGRLGWGEVVGVMALFCVGGLAAASGTFYAVMGIIDKR